MDASYFEHKLLWASILKSDSRNRSDLTEKRQVQNRCPKLHLRAGDTRRYANRASRCVLDALRLHIPKQVGLRAYSIRVPSQIVRYCFVPIL